MRRWLDVIFPESRVDHSRAERAAKHPKFCGTLWVIAVMAPMAIFFLYYLAVARSYYSSHPHWTGREGYVADSVLGYRNVAELRRGLDYTDSRGARVRPGILEAPRRVDVLVAGGSFAYGLGVSQRATFAAKLAELTGLSVYNVAVNGYGTLTAMLRSERYLDLKPKVVVYALIDDHLTRNVIPCGRSGGQLCFPVPYLARNAKPVLPAADLRVFEYRSEIDREHAFGWNDFYWAVLRDWLRFSGQDAAGKNEIALGKLPPGFSGEVLYRLISLWLDSAQKNDFQLVVLYIPDLRNPAPAGGEIAKVMEQLRNRKRFQFVDAWDAVRNQDGLCLSEADCHPSEKGHGVIARKLSTKVKERSKIYRGQHDMAGAKDL